MAEIKKVLDVAGVSKRFGDVEVLSDVSFQVDKGETICVLGPSGSGKSTLLRCINWLERPDAGQIYLNGERVGINGAGIARQGRAQREARCLSSETIGWAEAARRHRAGARDAPGSVAVRRAHQRARSGTCRRSAGR